MSPIRPGDIVAVRCAGGGWVQKRVVSEGGYDFPCWNVVWPDEGDEHWTPWPIEDVRPLLEVPDALSHAEYAVSSAAPEDA